MFWVKTQVYNPKLFNQKIRDKLAGRSMEYIDEQARKMARMYVRGMQIFTVPIAVVVMFFFRLSVFDSVILYAVLLTGIWYLKYRDILFIGGYKIIPAVVTKIEKTSQDSELKMFKIYYNFRIDGVNHEGVIIVKFKSEDDLEKYNIKSGGVVELAYLSENRHQIILGG